MTSHDDEATEAEQSTARWRLALIILTVASILCLSAGIALPFVADAIFRGKMAEMLPISPNSATYNSWVSSELRFQVWMWNITNSWNVLNAGAVPNVSQVGPFTFKETRTRASVQFHANNTVGYDDVRTYYFLPDESVGSMADFTITNVNLPYLGVALRTRDKSPYIRKMLRSFLVGQRGEVFANRTVEELLLGYEDVGMQGLGRLASLVSPDLKLPSRFGIMLGKNSTAKGSALVGTGADNIANLNNLHLWNGKANLNIWRQEWANRVVGTDGAMFAPPITEDRTLQVFTPDLCRSANMTYRRTGTVHGIPVLSFSPAKTALMSASKNPDNLAFCTPHCLDSGVLNLSLCLPGSPPIVASAPHLHGAQSYANAIVGLQPGGPEFETRLDVEPNTGLLLRAARRMQINAALEHVDGFPDTEPFGRLYIMPYLWLNESGSIGALPAAGFKRRVLWPKRLASLIAWILLALGLALAVVSSVVCCLELRLRSARRRLRRRALTSGERSESLEWRPLKKDENLQRRELQLQLQPHQQAAVNADQLLKSLPETDIM